MRIKRFNEYSAASAWLSLLWALPLAIFFSQGRVGLFLHELGHYFFGFGGRIEYNLTYCNIDWIGATYGGFAFPMLFFAFLGRLARCAVPPYWALAVVFAQAYEGFEYDGAYACDYPYHDPTAMATILAIIAISTYILFKSPGHGRIWYALHAASGIQTSSDTPSRAMTKPSHR
jgi:hypothetical protein